MAGQVHPPTIANPLYEWLLKSGYLPEFLRGENGERLFQLIFFTWLVIIVLVVVSFITSRTLKKIPGRLQSTMEIIVDKLAGLLDSLIGHGGRNYLGFLGTMFIFIFCLNLIGLIPGMMSPTSNWNCTVALAIVTILYVQASGIKSNGFVGYLKHMGGSPKGVAMWIIVPLMFPIHLLGEVLKPLSLSLRLYGNISGEDTIILSMVKIAEGIKVFGMPLIPLPLPMMGFAIFTSFLQAFIFTALSCIYIMILTAHDDGH